MLCYSGLHAQESFYDSVNRTSEKLIELNRAQEKLEQLEKESRAIKLKEPQTNNNGPYNFTVSDALGGPSLNADPAVQRAKAEKEKRESANTLTSTSIIEPSTRFVDTTDDASRMGDGISWEGIIPIIFGIMIWFFWARDYNKGVKDHTKQRMVYDTSLGCVPWIVAFLLIGIGVYVLAQ